MSTQQNDPKDSTKTTDSLQPTKSTTDPVATKEKKKYNETGKSSGTSAG